MVGGEHKRFGLFPGQWRPLFLICLKYWGQTWLLMWSVSSLARTGFFLKLLLGYSFAVFAANSMRHQLNAVLLLCSRQQYT